MMDTISAQSTWGITGAQFAVAYGALCALVAIAIRRVWRQAVGPEDAGNDPLPALGLHQLAMLGGGPQLAITTAATQLHRDGLLRIDASSGRLTTAGRIDPGADALEREVFETVRRDPPISVHALRADVAQSDALRTLRERLTTVGLLLDEQQSRRLRRLWLAGVPLAALGIVFALGAREHGGTLAATLLIVAAVVLATLRLACARPLATQRGRALVRRSRDERDDLRRHPLARDSTAAAALFGGGALWLAAPEVASALDVPREDGSGWWQGAKRGGGCSMGGGGGCGAISSCGGGGGCGGGGCGGG